MESDLTPALVCAGSVVLSIGLLLRVRASDKTGRKPNPSSSGRVSLVVSGTRLVAGVPRTRFFSAVVGSRLVMGLIKPAGASDFFSSYN